jgi:hypothetical protein
MQILMRIVAAFILLSASAVSAQAPAKAPAPAGSVTEELIRSWNDTGRKLVAMAEDWPESEYDFKPHPTVRSFAEQLLHAAGGNYLFLKASKGEPWSIADGNPPRDNYKTKAQVVAFVKQAFADVEKYLRQQGESGLAQTMKYPFGNRMILRSMFWMDVLPHAGEHYGQLVMYYRVSGKVPPESR